MISSFVVALLSPVLFGVVSFFVVLQSKQAVDYFLIIIKKSKRRKEQEKKRVKVKERKKERKKKNKKGFSSVSLRAERQRKPCHSEATEMKMNQMNSTQKYLNSRSGTNQVTL